MAYNITNSRGTSLTISDGAKDSSSTSLVFVGKNTTGYGQDLNTNFYKLLENFASNTAPSNTVSGQLWYDITGKTLKVYDEGLSDWKNIGTVTAGTSTPSSPTVGDTFFKTDSGVFYVYDGVSSDLGSGWKLIGPQTSASFGIVSGTLTSTVGDSKNATRVTVGDTNVAILTTESFLLSSASTNPTNFPTGLVNGLTVDGNVKADNFEGTTFTGTYFTGTAENANKLGNIVASSYVTAGSGNVTTLTGDTILAGEFTMQGNIIPYTANVYTIGNITHWFSSIYATASQALYADIAERFSADAVYDPGTLVRIGGTQEVTQENEELSTEVLGVVSTSPAYLMNAGIGEVPTFESNSLQWYDGSAGSTLNPPIVIGGRAPVKVVGTVNKGQRLVSAGNGIARGALSSEISAFNTIGRSLEDKNTTEISTVMAVIKINT